MEDASFLTDTASTSRFQAFTKNIPLPLLKGFEWKTIYGKSITFFQISSDFLTAFFCYLASYWFYTDILDRSSPQSLIQFIPFSIMSSSIYVIALDRMGLYHREISLLNIKELRGIFRVGIYAALIVLSSSFYVRTISFSRITLTAAIISTPILIYLQRQIFYRFHLLFHQMGWSQRKVFIYGAGNIGTHLAKRMFESPTLGLFPCGFLDDRAEKQGQSICWRGPGPKKGVRILGGEDLIARAKEFGIDYIVIALPSASFERNQQLVKKCVEAGIDYAVVPNSYEKFIQKVELFELGGIPLLRRRNLKPSPYYHFTKRSIDFILSLAFILLLSPLYLVLGTLIKLDSPGPVLFKQKRAGKDGHLFSFYKFRSMYVDAPQYAFTPTDPSDPRITRMGRWLRRTSLDELPQLFNVFRGNMSLVGPRPEMPFIVEKYTTIERERLKVKPGITGVWQISAVRGEPIHKNMEYDLFYLNHQSLLLDFAILLKTILSVIAGIGAV